jgi:hypothetical protein
MEREGAAPRAAPMSSVAPGSPRRLGAAGRAPVACSHRGALGLVATQLLRLPPSRGLEDGDRSQREAQRELLAQGGSALHRQRRPACQRARRTAGAVPSAAPMTQASRPPGRRRELAAGRAQPAAGCQPRLPQGHHRALPSQPADLERQAGPDLGVALELAAGREPAAGGGRRARPAALGQSIGAFAPLEHPASARRACRWL